MSNAAGNEQVQWPDGSTGEKRMTFVTSCPNCGDLSIGHKPGCSDMTSCVEYVEVVPASSVEALVSALEKFLATEHPEGRPASDYPADDAARDLFGALATFKAEGDPDAHEAERLATPQPDCCNPQTTGEGETSCSGVEDRYVANFIAETGKTVNDLLVACGNLLSVREHSPRLLDSEFEDFKAEVEAASAALYPTATPEPQKPRYVSDIELGEALPAWGAAKDQEGVLWLTCQGNPILNLDTCFKRAACLSTQPSQEGEGQRWTVWRCPICGGLGQPVEDDRCAGLAACRRSEPYTVEVVPAEALRQVEAELDAQKKFAAAFEAKWGKQRRRADDAEQILSALESDEVVEAVCEMQHTLWSTLANAAKPFHRAVVRRDLRTAIKATKESTKGSEQ